MIPLMEITGCGLGIIGTSLMLLKQIPVTEATPGKESIAVAIIM
jgi:hypothetical protein